MDRVGPLPWQKLRTPSVVDLTVRPASHRGGQPQCTGAHRKCQLRAVTVTWRGMAYAILGVTMRLCDYPC